MELIAPADRYEQGSPRRVCGTCAWAATQRYCVNCGSDTSPENGRSVIPAVRAQQLGVAFENAGLRRGIRPEMLDMVQPAPDEYVILSAVKLQSKPKGLRTQVGHGVAGRKVPLQGGAIATVITDRRICSFGVNKWPTNDPGRWMGLEVSKTKLHHLITFDLRSLDRFRWQSGDITYLVWGATNGAGVDQMLIQWRTGPGNVVRAGMALALLGGGPHTATDKVAAALGATAMGNALSHHAPHNVFEAGEEILTWVAAHRAGVPVDLIAGP